MTAAPAAGPGLRGSPRALLKTAAGDVFRFPRFQDAVELVLASQGNSRSSGKGKSGKNRRRR